MDVKDLKPAPQVSFPFCLACGTTIDGTGLCSYECERDGKTPRERDPTTVADVVYVLVAAKVRERAK